MIPVQLCYNVDELGCWPLLQGPYRSEGNESKGICAVC